MVDMDNKIIILILIGIILVSGCAPKEILEEQVTGFTDNAKIYAR